MFFLAEITKFKSQKPNYRKVLFEFFFMYPELVEGCFSGLSRLGFRSFSLLSKHNKK